VTTSSCWVVDGAAHRRKTESLGGRGVEPTGLWHVTLTVGGHAHPPTEVRAAMERLSDERPFMLSGRYSGERAEFSYWEEAGDCSDAAALALRLWGEHRRTAGLPDWSVCGLEVLARDEYIRRDHLLLAEPGTWQPF